IAALMEVVTEGAQALKEDRYQMGMSAAFHIRVAACTHNPAIEMLVQSFHGPMLMSLEQARAAAPLMGRRGTDEHRKLTHAIAERDLETATTVMRTHINRTAKRVKTPEK
ncbi:FCD domain-containing protein, partial [Streptomyces sp. NPDC005318]|uniref:FCD domain-containing protein n=1 Tax=Streptomyces sp. NPDC005318 TaxID=3157031 RepID=UPI0033B3B4AB